MVMSWFFFNRVLMMILSVIVWGYDYSVIQLIHPSSLDRNMCFHWYVFELSLHKAPRWMVHLYAFVWFLIISRNTCLYVSISQDGSSIHLNLQHHSEPAHLKWLCLKIIENVAALNPFDNFQLIIVPPNKMLFFSAFSIFRESPPWMSQPSIQPFFNIRDSRLSTVGS